MLAEQYDAFVKFTHDQIMRRYGEQPASCEYPFLPVPTAALDYQMLNGLTGLCSLLSFDKAPGQKYFMLVVWRLKRCVVKCSFGFKTRRAVTRYVLGFWGRFWCCCTRFVIALPFVTFTINSHFFLFSDVSWIILSAYVGCPIHPVLLLQAVPVMTCSNAIFFPPVNTGYFKLLSVATTLMQQLVLECSLMSVPPGCGPLLPVIIPVASFAVSLQFGFLC